MNLLPDIGPNGEFIYSSDDLALQKRYPKFKEELEKLKIKADEASLEELNNMGHKKITPDFEDSPFADRQPKINEE